MAKKIDLPKDYSAETIQLVPAKTAVAKTVDATISAATDVTLNADTSFIEAMGRLSIYPPTGVR